MASRNIGEEILGSVREIKAGGGRRYRFTAPDEIWQMRERVGKNKRKIKRRPD